MYPYYRLADLTRSLRVKYYWLKPSAVVWTPNKRILEDLILWTCQIIQELLNICVWLVIVTTEIHFFENQYQSLYLKYILLISKYPWSANYWSRNIGTQSMEIVNMFWGFTPGFDSMMFKICLLGKLCVRPSPKIAF